MFYVLYNYIYTKFFLKKEPEKLNNDTFNIKIDLRQINLNN